MNLTFQCESVLRRWQDTVACHLGWQLSGHFRISSISVTGCFPSNFLAEVASKLLGAWVTSGLKVVYTNICIGYIGMTIYPSLTEMQSTASCLLVQHQHQKVCLHVPWSYVNCQETAGSYCLLLQVKKCCQDETEAFTRLALERKIL